MLQASALFLALLALWMLAGHTLSVVAFGAGAGVALLCVLMTSLMTGFGRNTFTSLPRRAIFQLMHVGIGVSAALATLRRAIAGDVKLKPALVRVRTQLASDIGVAEFASTLNAAGAIVVAIDDDGLLLHLNEENDQSLNHMRRWEAQIASAVGERTSP